LSSAGFVLSVVVAVLVTVTVGGADIAAFAVEVVVIVASQNCQCILANQRSMFVRLVRRKTYMYMIVSRYSAMQAALL
jgi:hypothetical protein